MRLGTHAITRKLGLGRVPYDSSFATGACTKGAAISKNFEMPSPEDSTREAQKGLTSREYGSRWRDLCRG